MLQQTQVAKTPQVKPIHSVDLSLDDIGSLVIYVQWQIRRERPVNKDQKKKKLEKVPSLLAVLPPTPPHPFLSVET